MKNLLGKLKGLDFKRLGIAHGEKFAFGLIAFLALLAAYRSLYWGFPKTPEELAKDVKLSRDQLRDSQFPEERRKQFASSAYFVKAQSMFTALPLELFAYTLPNGSAQPQPMFWPVVPPIEQIKEPEFLAVADLQTKAGRTIVALQPPEIAVDGTDPLLANAEAEEAVSEEDENFAPSRPVVAGAGRAQANVFGGDTEPEPPKARGKSGSAKGAGKKKGREAARPQLSSGDTDSSGNSNSSRNRDKAEPIVHDQSREARFVAVRGVYDMKKQLERFAKANIPFPTPDLVEFLDFAIERQRAVAGPDPWAGPWEPVDIKVAIKLLNETAALEFDVVDPMLTNPVITMPLPERLTGRWTTIGSHPKIKEMTAEETERAKKATETLLAQYKELGEERDPLTKGGFADQTLDMRVMQRRVGGRAAGGDSSYDGAAPQVRTPTARAAPVIAARSSAARGPGGAADSSYDGADNRGGNRPGGRGAMSDSGLVGKVILFRYLDFDVEPGESYRYRVKLTLMNPNFQRPLEEVVDASVIEGETRQTKWSEPSTPASVSDDTKIFLTEVVRKLKNFRDAKMEVFQWDAKVGTMISDGLLVPFGQFIGGDPILGTTWYLDPAIPSFQKEKVQFSTRDMLVDTSFAPQIVVSEHPDLNLEPRVKTPIPRSETIGIPDQAAVINRFGQLVIYDNVPGKQELATAKKLLKDERQPFEELAKANRDDEGDGAGLRRGKGSKNPLQRKRRRGKRGGGGGGGMGSNS